MPVEIKVPPVGESVTEVTVGQWLKKDGEYVNRDEIICEIESEKATLEVPSPETGSLKILVPEGETAEVGSKIAELDTSAAKEIPESKAEESLEPTPEVKEEKVKPGDGKPARISPVAAKMLQEANIPPEQVEGSGAGGRVTKSDVQQVLSSRPKTKVEEVEESAPPVVEQKDAPSPIPVRTSPQESSQLTAGDRIERRKKMTTLRKTISRRLVQAKNQTAMLTTFNEVNMQPIKAARTKFKDLFKEKYGVKLGFMSFFVKACVLALQEFPLLNARLEEDEIIFHDFVDISVAVSTERGLVVPVIFNAEKLTLAQIEAEVGRLALKARDNKLTIDEMTGGTFSITNGGVFGSLLSTPILNSPQSAILGMHKIEERPIAQNGEVVIRPMMYLAMSYDHRIVDGRESVSFLVRVKELLEDPLRMLLEV